MDKSPDVFVSIDYIPVPIFLMNYMLTKASMMKA